MAKQILIVEDVSFLQKAMKVILKDAGYDVIIASNGEDGLNKALKKHPDLILLDILMPKMDGMTMLKELRKDPWGKKAPVIILTNLNDKEKLIEATKEHVVDYYVKSDWEIDEIVKIVDDKLK
jgi:CheY-like chemotaxis protein